MWNLSYYDNDNDKDVKLSIREKTAFLQALI